MEEKKHKYRILKTCIGCRNCYKLCPVGAVLVGPMRIDEEKCIGCGECYRRCPVKKIIELE